MLESLLFNSRELWSMISLKIRNIPNALLHSCKFRDGMEDMKLTIEEGEDPKDPETREKRVCRNHLKRR